MYLNMRPFEAFDGFVPSFLGFSGQKIICVVMLPAFTPKCLLIRLSLVYFCGFNIPSYNAGRVLAIICTRCYKHVVFHVVIPLAVITRYRAYLSNQINYNNINGRVPHSWSPIRIVMRMAVIANSYINLVYWIWEINYASLWPGAITAEDVAD